MLASDGIDEKPKKRRVINRLDTCPLLTDYRKMFVNQAEIRRSHRNCSMAKASYGWVPPQPPPLLLGAFAAESNEKPRCCFVRRHIDVLSSTNYENRSSYFQSSISPVRSIPLLAMFLAALLDRHSLVQRL